MPEPVWHTIDGSHFDSVSALTSHQKVGMTEPDWHPIDGSQFDSVSALTSHQNNVVVHGHCHNRDVFY